MHDSGTPTSIKVIAFTGILTFGLLLFAAYSMRVSLKPPEAQRVGPPRPQTDFDAERAYNDLEVLAKLGPRSAGSDAARQAKAYLAEALRKARFPETVGEDNILLAHTQGAQPGALLVMARYTTPEDFEAPQAGPAGAESGASAAALMLELARQFGPERDEKSIFWAWLAAENEAAAQQALRLSQNQNKSGEVAAAIHLGPAGDCFLDLTTDDEATLWMREIVGNIAARLDYGAHFGGVAIARTEITGSFRAEGKPAIYIGDRFFGGSMLTHKKWFANEEDTLDRVCPGSLQVAGDLLHESLITFDGRLEMMQEEKS